MIKKSILLSIITGVGNYILIVLVINKYGLVARGFIEVINSILTIALSILSFNYYTSVTKSVAIYREIPQNWNVLSSGIQIIQIIFVVLMMAAFNESELNNNFKGVYWVALAAVTVVVGSQTNINIAALNGLKKIEETKYINLSGLIICSFFLLPALEYFEQENAIALYFILTYVGQYLVSEIVKRSEKIKICEINAIKIEFLKNGSILYAVSILQIIGSRIHVFTGAKILGLEEVGAFGMLFGIAQFILMPATIMTTYFISDTNIDKTERDRKIRTTVAATILMCFASILFVFLVKYINIKIGGLEQIGMTKKLVELTPGIISFAISSMLIGIMSNEKMSKLKMILYAQLAGIIIMPVGIMVFAKVANPMEKSYTLAQIIILIVAYLQKKRNDNNSNPILE